jgi:hypothetical protein
MKTHKKIILSAVLALLFVTNVCSASAGYDYAEDAPKLADKMKFGVGIGRGFIEGSPFIAKRPAGTYIFLDLFGEYKFSDEYGLRLSIQPTSSSLVEALHVGYCNVGLTHRVYVGQDKQLCLFIGGETSILSSAKLKAKDLLGEDKELDLYKKEDFEKIYSSKSKLNKVRSKLKIGWDYECENGLIIGGIFTSTWASEDEENDDKNNSVYVLPASTQQLVYLGYNFAKLFN